MKLQRALRLSPGSGSASLKVVSLRGSAAGETRTSGRRLQHHPRPQAVPAVGQGFKYQMHRDENLSIHSALGAGPQRSHGDGQASAELGHYVQ